MQSVLVVPEGELKGWFEAEGYQSHPLENWLPADRLVMGIYRPGQVQTVHMENIMR